MASIDADALLPCAAAAGVFGINAAIGRSGA
jgi:hypothetical protein